MGRKKGSVSGNSQDYRDNKRRTSTMIPIFEECNCYYLDRGDDKTAKRLTNFVMEPVKGIQMQDGSKTEIEFSLRD